MSWRTCVIIHSCVAVLAIAGAPEKRLSAQDNTLPVPKKLCSLEAKEMVFHSATFSPDGRLLATLGTSNAGKSVACVWDVATGKLIRTLCTCEATGLVIRWSPVGGIIAIGQESGVTTLYDTQNVRDLMSSTVQGARVTSLAFSSNGQLLGIGGSDGRVVVWNPSTGKRLVVGNSGVSAMGSPNHRDAVSAVCFSREDQSLLIGRGGGNLSLFEVFTDRLLWQVNLDNGIVVSLALSADGRTFAARSVFGLTGDKLSLWEMASGECRRRITNPTNVVALAFTSGGDLVCVGGDLVCVGGLETLRLWNEAGREVCLLHGTEGVSDAICVNNGRAIFASQEKNADCAIWELRTPNRVLHRDSSLESDGVRALLSDLEGADTVRAYRAVQLLEQHPGLAINTLRHILAPAPKVGMHRLNRLLSGLNDSSFRIRENSEREISNLGDSARNILSQALTRPLSAEARRRLRRLLDNLGPVTAGEMRSIRSIEILEFIGDVESKQLLGYLAGGETHARITMEAKASLERLDRFSQNCTFRKKLTSSYQPDEPADDGA